MTESKTNFHTAHADSTGRSVAAPAWAKDLRLKSYDAFTQLGLPSRKNEEWKYTSLRALAERTFRLPDLAEATAAVDETLLQPILAKGDITLVFVNGVLSTGLSKLGALPSGVKVLPMSEALVKEASLVREPVHAALASTESTFEHLSKAFLGDTGLLLQVAAGVKVEAPIHIVHVATKATVADQAVFPRHRIDLATGARAQVVESYVGPAELAYLTVPVTDVSLAEGSELVYARIQADGDAAINIGTTRAVVATDASFRTFALGTGAKLSRFDLDIALVGERASATLDGLYLVRGEQHLDNHTVVDHRAPATKSDQVYKGILTDSARAVFNGKVKVRHSAPQTDARQLNKNLLLSSNAEIDTKPELQIDVDDVKCSHGAAIGRLDADEIFYLQSRGLDRARAERLLMHAFAEDVILRLGAPSIEARLLQLAERALT